MGRAPCCDKANVKRGPWSPEEDAELKAYIEENGTGGNWIALPQKIGLKRCGKSCRLRWLNYLRPNIKHGGFSEEEDQIICRLYISIGSRWSIIAAQLPGRTDNDIKNYWNTRLKKKLLGRRKEPSQSRRALSHNQELNLEPNGSDHDSSPIQTLSSTAIERMQLHLQLQGPHSPFSFYNNPALWPKFHPLGAATHFQGQADAPSAANNPPMHQVSETSAFEPNHPSLFSIKQADDSSYPPMSASVQADFCESSNFNSVADGLQAELQSLLNYGNSGCSIGQDSVGEFESFPEMNGQGKENMNWWAANGFDEKSSSSSWDSASALQPDWVLQEYVLGYDQ